SNPSAPFNHLVGTAGRSGDFVERDVMEDLPGLPGSIRFDARELHHLAPLFGLFGDELAEVGRRAWKCGGAPLGKPRLHLGIGKGRVDLRVELVANASTLGVLCWKSSRENIVSTANFLGRWPEASPLPHLD